MNRNLEYNIKDTYKDKTYVECKHRTTLQCYARGVIVNGELTWTKRHFHPVDHPIKLAISRFKDQLRTSVQHSFRDFRNIYDDIASLNPLAAAHITFTSVESSMLRWRKYSQPPIPNSLTDLVMILSTERWKNLLYNDGSQLIASALRATDMTIVVVFGDLEFINKLGVVDELHLDATFKVCPRKPVVHQFFTIMARICGNVVPVAWALMEKKTTAAYTAVLDYFSINLAPEFQPQIIIVDYENALNSAVSETYPYARICRCFFHYTQALMKRFDKNDRALLKKIKNWRMGQIFIRKLMALALLPPDDVIIAYELILSNAINDIKVYFRNFLRYFEFWLYRVTPAKFSIFPLACRTNNYVEAYHRVLHQRMGTHPNIWEFIDSLRRLQSITSIEVQSLGMGQRIRRKPRKEENTRNLILNRAWELFRNGEFDIAKFLAFANHYLPAFDNDHLIEDRQQVDDFITIPDHNIAVNPAALYVELPLNCNDERMTIRPALPFTARNAMYLLRNLENSLCPVCRLYVVDISCTPCWHWYLCKHCTQSMIDTATAEGADLRCHICYNICVAFQEFHVSLESIPTV